MAVSISSWLGSSLLGSVGDTKNVSETSRLGHFHLAFCTHT
ncbi:hypothetical protein ACFFF5_19125 [Lederbergia wuyishanensis]|uniref:Uncharacterized protein n=1 Tax=Lederbergia wuyishanensis TaxID=1347903 RepID=A0ABU0D5F9_9BACI|nr:hypothetical protein [Lederbergia wuyishanensis]MDQ0343630.1 hypothetical protein [Lederbergia wuyishanensis]